MAITAAAQRGKDPAAWANERYVTAQTEPSFELSKVHKLIKAIKFDAHDNLVLPAAKFKALDTKGKFTYCMIHGEVFDQNCSGMPYTLNADKRIAAYTLGRFGDDSGWSHRQRAFLRENRKEIIPLLRSTIQTHDRVGVNLKEAIMELQAWELIPDLVGSYDRDRKDQDILSVCCVLMKDGHYKPFMKSANYKALYGPKASYQAFVDASPANENRLLKQSIDFYMSRKK